MVGLLRVSQNNDRVNVSVKVVNKFQLPQSVVDIKVRRKRESETKVSRSIETSKRTPFTK